eukprot:5025223-Prymnesium_polylepis.2
MPAQKRKADEVTPDDNNIDHVIHLSAHDVVRGLASSDHTIRRKVEEALLAALSSVIARKPLDR